MPIAGWLRAIGDPFDEPSRRGVDDPLEVRLADRTGVGVGSRVQEVDGVGHAVPNGELHGVEVVAERLGQRQATLPDLLDEVRIVRRSDPEHTARGGRDAGRRA